MILEVIIQSFFSGVGNTLLQEWMSQVKKKDEAKLRELIRQELEAFMRSSYRVPMIVDDADIDKIVQRIKAGENTSQLERKIIEEQLKRAKRRKSEIEEIISQARTIQ